MAGTGEPAFWKLVFGLSGTVRQVIRIVNWLFVHTHATTSQTMASFSDPLEGLFADTGSVGERYTAEATRLAVGVLR